MSDVNPSVPDPSSVQLEEYRPIDRSSYMGLRIAFIFTCAGLAVGAAGLYSYLSVELQRIEYSTRMLICLEELPMLLWFLWFVAGHSWSGKRFRNSPRTVHILPWEWWLALFTIAVALGFKLHTSNSLLRDESLALKNAALTNGEITQIQRKVRSGGFVYVYQGRFQDRNGVRHNFFHSANERHKEGWLQPLSQQTRQALKNGKPPARVSIAYDPDLPARNWVEGVEDNQWRLYNFLNLVVVVQLFFTVNFAIFLAIHIGLNKNIPWWYDLHMVLPLMVVSACIALAGLVVGALNPLLDLVFGN